MNTIKCAQCGLVSWPNEVECKRCGSLLTVQKKSAQKVDPHAFDPQPFFSTGLKVLSAILALAAVLVLFSRVFHLFDLETARQIAVIFILVGAMLGVLAHIWTLVRIFEQSIGWGFGALILPLVGLFAVAKFWEETRRSFIAQFVCMGILLVGFEIAPPT